MVPMVHITATRTLNAYSYIVSEEGHNLPLVNWFTELVEFYLSLEKDPPKQYAMMGFQTNPLKLPAENCIKFLIFHRILTDIDVITLNFG